MPLTSLIERHLIDPSAGWSVGSFGAIAEFTHDPGEAVCFARDRGLSAVTARGAIRLDPLPAVRPVPYETPGRLTGQWNHAIALCLPHDGCAMAGREVVTELGPDHDALREEDRQAVLFDMGLGQLQVDVCVRSTDPAVTARLRAAVGRSVFEPGNGLMAEMPALSPHRVFVCRFGRVEVFQPVPPPQGESPEGPHTHVLPKLLKHGRTHAATTPIPQGWVPCAQIHPANPARDAMGRSRPFDAIAHAAFQSVFEQFADPLAVAQKRAVAAAIRAGQAPDSWPRPERRDLAAALRVALRQIDQEQGQSALLSAWQQRFDAASAGDPAEDDAAPLAGIHDAP